MTLVHTIVIPHNAAVRSATARSNARVRHGKSP
ncbi:hypothetical protein J2X01_001410 [Arthrobacter ginsengisoli]|uniref:Uncharacterized protein n=1 Tax=Arthrobacter ginsengisoli TaxID=1356565 RepID=A0ABU1UAH5_9MICC|nr:hypothetical protein [Arthrobacter ginsengisoli]